MLGVEEYENGSVSDGVLRWVMTSGQGGSTYRFALLWHYYGVPEGMVLWDFLDLAAAWEDGSSTKAWPADVFGLAFRYADRK